MRARPVILWTMAASLCAAGADAPKLEWKREVERDGIVVEMAKQPQGAPWVRGTAVIPARAEAIRAVLLDVPSHARFMPHTTRAEWIANDAGQRLTYERYKVPWPMSDRDAVCQVAEESSAAGYKLSQTNVATPLRPPVDGVVRLIPVRTTWILERTDGGTRIVYTYLGELGGTLPEFIQRKAWQEEPLQAISAVWNEVARRAAKDGGSP